ncbi:MAG: transcriptional regulator with GAF, ATPase, and Fis domain [Planctomycetota bacterium]|jgi:transcriptional regulator with GAF, ATPase, and Fis domain
MKLTVVEEGSSTVLDLESSKVRLGRAIDNDVRLSGKLVSRHHCELEVEGDTIWVTDLASANGTLINGRRIDRQQLTETDELSVGGARIQICGMLVIDELESEVAENDQTIMASGIGAVGLSTIDGVDSATADNLHVMGRITRALLTETDELRLLRLIVDSAVSLAGAERGFLLLPASDSDLGGPDARNPALLKVRLARSFEGADIPVPASRLSMGIAEKVLIDGRPLLSVDAGRDDRFTAMASVEDLRLRSVVCVSINVESQVAGVLYLDNRLQEGAFSENELDLLELLAGQAAIAIRNARQLAELRRRNERLSQSSVRIEGLNQQLGRKIRDRDSELAVVRAELERERGRFDYSSMVGASDGMREVFQQLDRIIACELPVYIYGESGTGKELIARAVHRNGARKDKPFVSLNCAALPDSLLESELFGHTRGAFTGATRSKKGLIEQASGGTLFLDEIGDMSVEMQKKFLRVLQEGEVRPLGSDSRISVDIRLVSASNRDLSVLIETGDFREDLFYRVNVIKVALPPLRERRDDIPLLAEALLARAARETGSEPPFLPHEVQAALVSYDWPGNVRELENEMRRLVVLAGDVVTLELVSPNIAEGSPAMRSRVASPSLEIDGDLRSAVSRFECEAIAAALDRTGGNKSRAAGELGISRFALQRKLDKYGLSGASTGKDDDGEDLG